MVSQAGKVLQSGKISQAWTCGNRLLNTFTVLKNRLCVSAILRSPIA